MNGLNWIDWLIVIISMLALQFVSLRTWHFMKGVEEFLSAKMADGKHGAITTPTYCRRNI